MTLLLVFSCSTVSDSLWAHEFQHVRVPCPSPSPGVCSCPLSQWCHPTISSSVVPFSSWLQSFPASGSFPMSRLWGLFKKTRDTKGTFHAKIGSIKDRNCVAVTEAEDIKNRWQEYIELYKKDLHNTENHESVITHTHLEPDILECRKHHYEQS